MALPQRLKLALDTNVLFDRAENLDFAVTLFDFLNAREITLVVTFTVLAELDSGITRPLSEHKARLAERAVDNLPSWQIELVVGEDSDRRRAADVSHALRRDHLLPNVEVNDGLIFAEAALAGAQYLVTSDEHLISMDRDKTKQLLNAYSLADVHVVSPRNLYRRLNERSVESIGR